MSNDKFKPEETLEDISEAKNEFSSDLNIQVVKMHSQIVKPTNYKTEHQNIKKENGDISEII